MMSSKDERLSQEANLPKKEKPSIRGKLALRRAKRTPQRQKEIDARRREREKKLAKEEKPSTGEKRALLKAKRAPQRQEELDARRRERKEKLANKENLPKEEALPSKEDLPKKEKPSRKEKITLRKAKRTPQRQQELDTRRQERAKAKAKRKQLKFDLQNRQAAEAKIERKKERQERKAASIGVLPEELLLKVFSYVQDFQPRLSTLASIALVSRPLRKLVTPILYSKYSDSEARSASYREPKNKPNRTCLFFRTILKFPNLAEHVKTAELEFSSEDRLGPERSLDAERVLQTACSRLLPLDGPFWADQANNQSMDTITAAILYFLPKLESLSLYLSDEEFSVHPILDAVVSDRNGRVVLANLQKLRIEACDNFDLNYMDIGPWLRLPSLTNFTGEFISVGSDVSTSGHPNLTSVSISEGAIRKPFLGNLLGSGCKLESFSYVFNTNGAVLDGGWATPFEIIYALRGNASDSLTSLEICCPAYEEEIPASWNPSMTVFKKLECLKIDGCLLPQPTFKLPRSIKELHLHDCYPYFTERVEKLTNAIKLAHPALGSSGFTLAPCPSESSRR